MEGLDIKKFKRKSKELKVSTNELAQAVLSMSVRKYMQETGDQSQEICVSTVFSLRDIPRSKSEIEAANIFVPQTYRLALHSDISSALNSTKHIFRHETSSETIQATKLLLETVGSLPLKTLQLAGYIFSTPVTVLWSSLPLSSNLFTWNGCKVKSMNGIAPAVH